MFEPDDRKALVLRNDHEVVCVILIPDCIGDPTTNESVKETAGHFNQYVELVEIEECGSVESIIAHILEENNSGVCENCGKPCEYCSDQCLCDECADI